MRFSSVLFDLDGTLLDTLDDLTDATNAVLAASGYPARTRAEVRQFVGNGIRLLMARALPAGTCEAEIRRRLALFRTIYAANMKNHTGPYPGIPAMLDAMQARGVQMAIVSNKFDPAVQDLCRAYFSPWISVAIGERPGVRKKPAPDGVFEAARSLGAPLADVLYVGDSDVDVQTARNAGIACVGVTWGFRDRAVLEAAGADYLIDRPDELEALLRG